MAWNGSDGAAKPQKGERKAKPSAWRGLLAAIIVIGGAAGVYLYFFDARTTAKTPDVSKEKSGRIATVNPDVPPLPQYEEVLKSEEELIVLPNGVITNKPKTIAEAVAMVRLKPGFHRYKSVDDVFAKTNDFQIGEYKQPLFKTQVESHLSMVASMPRDRVVPPMPSLPPNMEKDFEQALDSIIEINDDDTDDDAQTKIRVATMKEIMRHLVENEGMSVSQAFREIEKEHNRLANMTALYKGAYRKMVLTGDESAEAFLERANEELRKAGACEFDENAQTINP